MKTVVSDSPVTSVDKPKASKWKNRERVMIICSRGTSFRNRHLMQDLRSILPHSKADSKLDKKKSLYLLNEICEMRNCTKCIYFESKKKQDLYLWLSNPPRGPSIKFLVHNIHTMQELKLTGNCLKGSRPVLSFDETFDTQPHLLVMKEMLIQAFGTPFHHPKSQPFVDHVLNFAFVDNKIWFRNFQIVEETGKLEEIGPRMVLEVIKIFDGSFGGACLFENPSYVSPNEIRRKAKQLSSGKYISRIYAKKSLEERQALRKDSSYKFDPTDDVFTTTPVKEELNSEDESEQKPEKRKLKQPSRWKRKKQKN